MVVHLADGVDAACAGQTRIKTLPDGGSLLVRQADPVWGAVGVDDALRAAVGRLADVVRQAGAVGAVVDFATLGVLPARVGVARPRRRRRLLWRDSDAAVEGVAGEAGGAGADGLVLAHVALCSDAADSDAGILALLPDAGLVGLTLLGDDALWVAVVGLAEEAWLAAAHHAVTDNVTVGIRTTRVRVARRASRFVG